MALVGLGAAMTFVTKPKVSTGTASTARTNAGPRAVHKDATESSLKDLGPDQRILIRRMNEELPRALEEMKTHGQKITHWAWWAFPTELKGGNEPHPPTCVTKATAADLIANAPPIWKETLECVCKCVQNGEDQSVEKNGKETLPSAEDRGRVQHFVRFWSDVQDKPTWLENVIIELREAYGSA